MNKKQIVFLLALFLPFASLKAQYDICVYGGTSAGVIAAYTARKMGKSVLLVEPGNRLGGLTTGGLGYTDIGNKYAITGLSRNFYRRVGDHYGKFEQWVFEPHVALEVFHQYIDAAKVKVLYGHRIITARREQGYIKEITVESSAAPRAATNKKITAKMFIDCSYEGDLMARAGVPYTTGREANSQYNETFNGVQLLDGHQFPDGIDPYKVPGDSTSGLLWGISNGSLAPSGSGDKKIQAYNYRICLTDSAANRIPITRPAGYDSTRYELLLRLMAKTPWKSLWNGFAWSPMPNRKTDINNNKGFSTDMIGMNYEYPDGSYEERKAIIDAHTAYTKGLLYFLGHDPRVAQNVRDLILQWDYPKDEYTENGNWTPQLYIREARRMVGAYVMTQANCQGRETVDDGVGMAAYTMDSHNCQRIVVNGMVKNEGNVEKGGFGPYPISYRSLIPQAKDCRNLLVPVCLSATHIAYGSIRMEPVFMVLAQSSAVAASMAIDKKQSVQDVPVKALQLALQKNPLADGSTPEILVDNDDREHVEVSGSWARLGHGGYGPSWLADTAAAKGSGSVQFRPEIARAGSYHVYAYFPIAKKPTAETYITVSDGSKETEKVIRKADIKVEGQTSGEWVSLGSYRLQAGRKAAVTVSNKNADGTVVADAILFVPQRE